MSLQRIRPSLSTLALALLAGCTTLPQATDAPPSAYQPVGLLLFGDHGYALDYIESDDRTEAMTSEQAIAAEREEWMEDKRPPAEFEPSPFVRLPDTGGYVPASGMIPVARAMAAHCRVARCDSAVMLGDNIYPNGPTGGADGIPDSKRFADILLKPYKNFGALAPNFRIYATLGNHDWRTSREAAMAEVHYLETTRPFYMDGIIYRVKPAATHGEVELFVLDTEVLLADETVYKPRIADDGSELPPTKIEKHKPWTKPQTERERNMVAWLEQALRSSTAHWKIVMGHHPLWSSAGGKLEQAKVLRRLILPTLCKYADMYVAGHEHTIEVHSDSCAKAVPEAQLPPLPQIVSGAASKQRPLNTLFMAHQAKANPELTTFYAKGMTWGYVHLTLADDRAIARVFTTPDDGSGTNLLESTTTFVRRTGEGG